MALDEAKAPELRLVGTGDKWSPFDEDSDHPANPDNALPTDGWRDPASAAARSQSERCNAWKKRKAEAERAGLVHDETADPWPGDDPSNVDKVRIPLDSNTPHELASRWLAHATAIKDLRLYQDTWWTYRDGRYRAIDTSEIITSMWAFFGFLVLGTPKGNKLYRATKEMALSMIEVLKVGRRVPGVAPCWLDGRAGDPRNIIILRNGLLDITTGQLAELSPAYFGVGGTDIAWDATATTPTVWLSFLERAWPNDPESIELLQLWMGYVLTADTSQQKMLLVLGPPRSGKGTIIRVLQQLVGPHNYVAGDVETLGESFALEPWIGKSLAIFADVKVDSKSIAVANRLRKITGEDDVCVNRKNIRHVTVKLPTRIMMAANRIPKFKDASGATAARFVVLRMIASHLGNEDLKLAAKLDAEMPAILRWAIDGVRKIRDGALLRTPSSSRDVQSEMGEEGSVISTWLSECCLRGTGYAATCSDLYQSFRDWCSAHGRDHQVTQETFGADLLEAMPERGRDRRRVGRDRVYYYTGLRLRTAFDDDPPETSQRDTSAGQLDFPDHEVKF